MKKLITIMLLACMSLPAMATSAEDAAALLTSLGIEVPTHLYSADIPDGLLTFASDGDFMGEFQSSFVNGDFLVYGEQSPYKPSEDGFTLVADLENYNKIQFVVNYSGANIAGIKYKNLLNIGSSGAAIYSGVSSVSSLGNNGGVFSFEYTDDSSLNESFSSDISNTANWKYSTEAMYDYITKNIDGITREDESLKDLFGKDILSALVGEAKKLKPAIKNIAYQMAAVQVGKPIRGICDNSVLLNVGGTVGNPACERLWMELEDISKKIRALNVIEPERYVMHDTSTGLLTTYSVLENQNAYAATTLTVGSDIEVTISYEVVTHDGQDYYWNSNVDKYTSEKDGTGSVLKIEANDGGITVYNSPFPDMNGLTYYQNALGNWRPACNCQNGDVVLKPNGEAKHYSTILESSMLSNADLDALSSTVIESVEGFIAGEYTWNEALSEWRFVDSQGIAHTIQGSEINGQGSVNSGTAFDFSLSDTTYQERFESRPGDLIFIDENGSAQYSSDLSNDFSVIHYEATMVNPVEDYNSSIDTIYGIADGYSSLTETFPVDAVMGHISGYWREYPWSYTETSEGVWHNDNNDEIIDQDYVDSLIVSTNPDFHDIVYDGGTEATDGELTLGDLFDI